MAGPNDIQTSFRLECDVKVPAANENLHDFVDRWSDGGIALPAAVVSPDSHEDIIAAIKYAASKRLQVLPAGGGHATSVVVDSQVLYLDMKKFRQVNLDVGGPTASVTFGGGALAEDVINACVSAGYYSLWPNSSAVGMTGFTLGGGSAPFNGLRGFAVDNVLSVTIITSSCEVLTLSASSSNVEHVALFNALRGSGFGLGVITSITLRAFPVSDLKLALSTGPTPEPSVWVRKAIFPGSPEAVSHVAEAYSSLLPPPPNIQPVLLFMRNPQTKAPMVILSVNCLGSAEDGERSTTTAFSTSLTARAIVNDTSLVPLARLTDATAPINAHGGEKQIYAGLLQSVSASSIARSFAAYVEFTNSHPSAARSYAVLAAWNTDVSVANGKTSKALFEQRDRGVYVQDTTWLQPGSDKETHEAAKKWGQAAVEVAREADREAGAKDWGFANNLRSDLDAGEFWSVEAIKEKARVKELWDPKGLFRS